MGIYSHEHTIFQQSVRRVCDQAIRPHLSEWEAAAHFPSTVFEVLGASGFLGILIDEKWGGVGGDYVLAAAWCEEFGRLPAVGLTTAVNMHSLVITPAVAALGSDEAKEKLLSDAVDGKAIGAYAFTEPAAGSDLSKIETRAIRDGDNYRLTGSKIFITNGARASFILVLAKTEPEKGYDGFTTFIVESNSPGFTVTRKMSKLGWHSSDTAELSFDDVLVPASMVLGKHGQGWHQAMRSLEWERLMLTLNALAGATACLEQTIGYVNDRRAFGHSIASFDTTRENLSLLWSRLQAGRALAYKSLLLLNSGERCRKEVSLAKLHVCQLAIEVADRCLQLHGGYGYTTEFLPERWLRDLRLNTIGGGTNEIMSRIAAKEIFSKSKS